MKTIMTLLGLGLLSVIIFNAKTNTDSANEKQHSELTLANIEALAQVENIYGYVPNTICYTSISSYGSGNKTHVTWCGNCSAQLAISWYNESKCNPKNHQ